MQRKPDWLIIWMYTGVVMLMVQVLLGGITRLTGSGLSITEWKPLLGAIPPMHASEWQGLFEKYKQIPQFRYLNADFTLADFKFIFFWEWLHRNWARGIGVVFLLPLGWFLYKRMIPKQLVPKLLGLFALGMAQGLIGWIMVASGLTEDNLYVSHIRLAVHFISALVLIAFTYVTALSLHIPSTWKRSDKGLRSFTIFLLVLLGLQLIYGAFMAGLKAAPAAPTWPDINGHLVPEVPGGSLFHHPLLVHFVHRNLGYLIATGLFFWVWRARTLRDSAAWKRTWFMPLLLVMLQVLLGIASVLLSTHVTRNGFGAFEWMAFLHQCVAMVLTLTLVRALFLLSPAKTGSSGKASNEQ